MYLHHGDRGINLRREREVYLILVPVPHPNSHPLLDILRRERPVQVHYKLGELLHVDDVLGLLGVCVYYLSAASHLEWLSGLEGLLVRR